MFGSTNSFGQSSGSAFGQTSSNPFAAPSGFGQTNTATNNPLAPKSFGSPTPAFGAQTGATSPFGSTSTGAFGQPSTPAFGSTSTGAFGQPSAPAFGSTSTGAFGQPSAPAFGSTSTGAFGQPSAPAFGSTSTGAFGQPSAPAFGSTSTGAFGQPSTPAFGSTSTGAFGQPSTPAFGSTSTSAFGQPSTPAFSTPSSSPFGSSTSAFGVAPAPAFGAAPAPAFGATSSTFNSGSLFGQKPSFGGFGSSPGQSSTFGSTFQQTQPTFGNSTFGTTTTPFFGATTPAFGSTSTSLFGTSSSTPAFGSTPFASATSTGFGPSGTPAFGVSSAPTFGVSSTPSFGPSTSAFSFSSSPSFGQTTAATSSNPFGTTTTPFGAQTSPFGLQTTAPFGQAPYGNQSGGTRIHPYAQSQDPDSATSGTQTAAKLDSISAMPAYKEKSHEELRWEDYQRGDKGGPNPSGPTVASASQQLNTFPSQPTQANPFTPKPSPFSGGTGGFTTASNPFQTSPINPFAQTSCSTFSTNTSPSLFSNTTSLFNTASTTTNLFGNTGLSMGNNTQSAGLFHSSPAIAQQPFSQPSSAPLFSSGSLFNASSSGMTGGFASTSIFSAPLFQPSAPAQTSSQFSFQPQNQPGFPGVSNTMSLTPFGQQSSQPNMVMQSALVSNPFGTLPATPQMSIGIGGSSPSIQYGISSLPVAEKPFPSRTLSMVVPRHLSQRRIKLLPRKYNPISDVKVPFFADDEESPVKPKADAFFVPRENPRSLIIRPFDQLPSRSMVIRQSDPWNSTVLDKQKDDLAGKDHKKAATSPTRSTPVENGFYRDYYASDEPEAVERHSNGASVKMLIPKLSHDDYFTEPSLEELAAKERAEPGYCCRVRDFVVGRQGYGSIKFLGETDVRGLDLESIVEFNNREVIVYKDDSKKPPVGEGLNKAAVVTLLNIKCVNRKTGEQCTEGPRLDKYKAMLVEKAEEQGAKFISFDAAKGEWKFRVEHFSSYRFSEAEVYLVHL